MTTPTMPRPRPELTLIVAATSKMGIGFHGGLPWSGLRREMAYFKRVTLRSGGSEGNEGKNTVIMGRKTWDSIPPRFRPLGGRRNIVISRSLTSSTSTNTTTSTSTTSDNTPSDNNNNNPPDGPEILPSLEAAISLLSTLGTATGKIFIIGGSQIYKAALQRKETKRVLLTRILGDFECDTFFPVLLPENGVGEGDAEGWVRRSSEMLGGWSGEGEEGVGEMVEEGGVRYRFEMWERV